MPLCARCCSASHLKRNQCCWAPGAAPHARPLRRLHLAQRPLVVDLLERPAAPPYLDGRRRELDGVDDHLGAGEGRPECDRVAHVRRARRLEPPPPAPPPPPPGARGGAPPAEPMKPVPPETRIMASSSAYSCCL